MIALLPLVGTALLAFPAAAAGPLGRLRAGEATRLAAVSIGSGCLAAAGGLVLIAAPTVLRTVRLERLASLCEHALGPMVAHDPVIGWLAAAAAIAVIAQMISALRAARRGARTARAEPWLGEHQDMGTYELVVVPTADIIAMSVPGDRSQVVVSEGVRRRLTPDEYQLVVRHEAAHLELGHRRHLLLVSAAERAFGWMPGVARSSALVRGWIETWADERAAGESIQARRQLSHAIAGLACTSTGTGDRRVDGSSGVVARVQRLGNGLRVQPGVARVMSYAPLLALALLAMLLVGGWFAESRHALALGGYCLG